MTTLADIAKRLESIATAATIASRDLLTLDTNPVPAEWTHITKIDPEEEKQLPLLFPLYLQHTSALEVGGSKDVTGENTQQTLELVADRPAPAFQEPSGPAQVTNATRERAEFLALPEVLNGDAESLVGQLGAGIEHIEEEIAPTMLAEKLPIPLGDELESRLAGAATSWMIDEAIFEAYIIQNPDSAAAREANVDENDLLGPTAAKQRAMAAERHHESEIIYLEYSGTFGDEEAQDILAAIDEGVSWSRVWYGGGLDDRESAQAVVDAGADATVVGNIFHEIAAEEVEICADAAAALGPDADRAAVESWVDETVDIDGTSAASYLSTITSLSNPTSRAREYLIATIEAYLGLTALADELDGTVTDEISLSVALDEREELPGEVELSKVLLDDEQSFPHDLVAGLLAERFDIQADVPPVAHIGVEI
ncbi:geranylgeranylglyceryl/heptaprenylglyceryl phosphate synthase [Halorhabdus rudnickae]|uniref:geranylgeranylglyceryl/heptaprenylglyceryl phosphate synthase n=1 Tax=Halorhabdus rudnickae TaxID=1775544 RepID=UPI001082AEC5|nr:geranylgeranylglyceryl/heptaprenylglyceryl phosphate synthase [Halorhabdus rudnickae]